MASGMRVYIKLTIRKIKRAPLGYAGSKGVSTQDRALAFCQLSAADFGASSNA
jgi:hypothetical protein